MKPKINRTCLTTISNLHTHYDDAIMGAIASQITSLTIVYSVVYSDAYQRKHQSAASLAFVRGIHRRTVNSPHKWPATRKMFAFGYVIMQLPFRCLHKPKSGPPHRRRVVNPRSHTPQEESFAKPGTPLLIILSLICKSYIELVQANLSSTFFIKKLCGQKYPREKDKCRNSIPYINHCVQGKYCQHPVQDKRCTERACNLRLSLSPSDI